MKDKARNEHAYEQITSILTATGKPMSLQDIHQHVLFRPMNASTRSLAQWLIYLTRTNRVARRGKGKRALFSLPAAAVPRLRKSEEAQPTLVVRVTKDRQFHSVRAQGGVEIAFEIV